MPIRCYTSTLKGPGAMIPLISGDAPQGHTTIKEAATEHKVTIQAHRTVPRPLPPIKSKEEDVTLSHRARVLQLKENGYSINEIALVMNLDIKTVTSCAG